MASNRYENLPLFGPDSADDSTNVNPQFTQNLWPKTRAIGSRNVIAMYNPPGLTKVATSVDGGPTRSNGVVFGGNGYMVIADKLVKMDSFFVLTSVGTLNSSAGRCTMVAGRDYILIVDGTDGYTYNGTTFAQVSDGDFPASPTHAAYLGGYFIVNKGDSDEFYISANEDPTSWGALDFDSAAEQPDNCLGLETTNRDAYVFGSDSTQVYYNSGDPDFPLTLYRGAVLEFGVAAAHSIASSSAGIFLLATAREGGIVVAQVNGMQPVIISNDIADDLKDFSTFADAEGHVYRFSDKTYYTITFPTEDKTFEYCVEDAFWIDRKSDGIGRHRVAGHVYFNQLNVFGDYNTAEIYKLDPTVYTEDGVAVERIRRSKIIHKGWNSLIFHELVLVVEAGVGTVSGAGSDPEVAMRYSDDDGHNWSSWLNSSMGQLGETSVQVYWQKLGLSDHGRIFEFKVTDPVKTVFADAFARVSVVK